MSATPEGAPADLPVSTFQVTHFLRPAAGSGWSQSQSAELGEDDAHKWIAQQAIEAHDLGFGDGPGGQPASPAVASAVSPSTGADSVESGSIPGAPLLGDS